MRQKPIERQPINGGRPCEEPPTEEQSCALTPCPQHCALGAWQAWSPCSKTCGGGIEVRHREITVFAMHGGKECGTGGGQTRACSAAACPVDCSYMAWSDWTECTQTCGGGTRFRSRDAVEATYGGRRCRTELGEHSMCNVAACPINCIWSEWLEWSSCSKSCDGGERTRERSRLQVAQNGGANCIGDQKEQPKCNTQACPSDCTWDSWDLWSGCSRSCGGGLSSRERRVLAQAKNGGAICVGDKTQAIVCKSDPCPVDCDWYSWTAFTECSQTCGGGKKSRTRSKRTLSQDGGMSCQGNQEELIGCGTDPCPVDCVWDTWNEWGECSKTCGSGKSTRTRSVKVWAKNRGKQCEGVARQDQVCEYQACAVDCLWKVWSDWTECTKTCGTGQRKRKREHLQLAQHGGRPCRGDSVGEGVCNTQICPVDCQWFEWDLWHSCTKTCGGGDRARERVKRVTAAGGGVQCVGAYKEHQACGTYDCPINCKWGEWSPWSQCSKSCGGGKRSRKRAVEIPGQAGGIQCRGDPQAYQLTQWCQTNPCPDDYGWMPPTRKQKLQAHDAGDLTNDELGAEDKDSLKKLFTYAFGTIFGCGLLGFLGVTAYNHMNKSHGKAEGEDANAEGGENEQEEEGEYEEEEDEDS